MTRILVTGSSDGLGQMAARLLVANGHQVVLHARNHARAAHAIAQVPGAQTALVGDLSSIAETKALAASINELGPFDAIIHNAAVGYQERERIATVDGLPHVFAVNSLAPYILTAMVKRPKRLVYMSSRLHLKGNPSLSDLTWESRRWSGMQAYSDSKLHAVLLAFAAARHCQMCCPTASNQVGLPRRWAALRLRMTLTSRPAPRRGSLQALQRA